MEVDLQSLFGLAKLVAKICRRCRWHQWQIFHRCRWYWWCALTCEYLREFSKKFEMVLMGYSGAGGKLIHEKKTEAKISWQCPFNPLWRVPTKKGWWESVHIFCMLCAPHAIHSPPERMSLPSTRHLSSGNICSYTILYTAYTDFNVRPICLWIEPFNAADRDS